MSVSADQPQADPYIKPGPAPYNSKGLSLFLEYLERRIDPKVLDVGPVCGENINFFGPRISKLYVCDLFLRLHSTKRKSQSPDIAFRHLDYPPEFFDGVLLWDLIDHLDNKGVRALAELSFTLVKPGGVVMVFALEKTIISPVVSSFIATDGFRVYLRQQHHLDLPTHGRENREILELLAPFNLAKSFIYRNGLREFLLRR